MQILRHDAGQGAAALGVSGFEAHLDDGLTILQKVTIEKTHHPRDNWGELGEAGGLRIWKF